MKDRQQTIAEEVANSVSHGIGFVAALIAAPILLVPALNDGRAGYLIGVFVFTCTMLLLYLTSSLYHALPQGKAKHLFNTLDHSAIYLFIAGTYTPFTLGVLWGHGGLSIGVLVWILAILGVILKASGRLSHPALSCGLYLMMGWLIFLGGRSMVARLSAPGIAWLLAGGIAYTVGVIFYVIAPRIRFSHLVWHLCVMTGTACHFFAVLWHAA
jgi:hemolysin III